MGFIDRFLSLLSASATMSGDAKLVFNLETNSQVWPKERILEVSKGNVFEIQDCEFDFFTVISESARSIIQSKL